MYIVVFVYYVRRRKDMINFVSLDRHLDTLKTYWSKLTARIYKFLVKNNKTNK